MDTKIQVADAMTKDPICVGPGESLYEAIKLMKANKVNSLVVREGNKLLGMVTDGDFVRHIILSKLDPEKVPIKQIMTTNLVTIEPEDNILDAMNLMTKENLRHLPVINRDKLVGLLTVKDVLKINPSLLELYIERVKIRESERKMSRIKNKSSKIEGICEICGKKALLSEIGGGMLVCWECKCKQE